MNTARPSLLVCLLGAWALLPGTPAQATVYRCGQTYQQTPCEGGKAVELPAGPSPAEVEAAQARAAATRQWADGMTEDRLAREKALAKARQAETTHRKRSATAPDGAPQEADGAGSAAAPCPPAPVRHAGAVSEAEARRARRAATRCKALAVYASLPASSPSAKVDTARQPLPASAATRGR